MHQPSSDLQDDPHLRRIKPHFLPTRPVPSAQVPQNITSNLYATFSARLQCCLDENGESISLEADFEEMNPDKHRRHIAWTNEEDSVVFRQFLKKRPRWTDMAKLMPGRTPTRVKSHCHSLLRQRLAQVKAAGINLGLQMEEPRLQKTMKREEKTTVHKSAL
jgi:hypothetical protein